MTAQTATAMQPAKTSTIAKQTETQNMVDRFQQVFDSIQKRAYEIFEDRGRWIGHDVSDWLQAESEILHPVRLEIAETDQAVTVRAEVPGFTIKELEIHAAGNQLTIAGKHESQEENTKGNTIYSERSAQEIFRSVELPSDADDQNLSASLKDGLLTIELPKAPRAKSARMEAKNAN
jgi:HSP20 family protein